MLVINGTVAPAPLGKVVTSKELMTATLEPETSVSRPNPSIAGVPSPYTATDGFKVKLMPSTLTPAV